MIGGVQQIKAHITLHTNGELILWPYGYTNRNVPPDMTGLDWKTFVALGRAQAAKNGYTAQQSSELYITDGDQIDWLYATYRIFTFTYELYPTETPTVWGDHYPDDSKIAARPPATAGAILHLINRAACPYAALGADATRADCGPLFDDLEINRGWTRNAHGNDTADAGLWSITNPSGDELHGAQAARQRPTPAPRRWSPAARRARARTPTTSTAAPRRSAAARSACPRAPPALRPAHVPLLPRPRQQRLDTSDSLRVIVEAEDGTPTVVFEELGAGNDDDAVVALATRSLADWAGQTIRIVVEATDGGDDSLVEAGIDDLRIRN